MKKTQKHIAMLIILTIILTFTGISHAAGSVTMQLTSSSKLEAGQTVEVTLAITNIDAGEGIDTVTAQLDYSKEVFEPITGKKSLEGDGDWSCVAYNEDDGVFILSSDSKVNTNSEVMKVKFKVKEGISVTQTEISIKDIVVSGGDETGDINVDMVSVTISAPEPVNPPTPQQPDTNTQTPEPAPDTNTQKPTTETPKTNTQKPTSNGSVQTNTDKTPTVIQQDNSKSNGKIPQTGTAENMIFFTISAISIMAIIAYIRYRIISKDIK